MILLIAAGVLGSVSIAVNTIDTTGMPDYAIYIIQGLKYIFVTSAVAPLFTIVRNLYGYYYNKYNTPAGERNNITYEASQMLATWLQYEEMIKGFGIFFVIIFTGTQWSQYAIYAAGAFSFFIDLIRSSLAKIAQKP